MTKSIMILIFTLLILSNSYSQSIFKSAKHGYTFNVPNGWRIKPEVVDPKVDAKIVDDKGNSLVVAVEVFNEVIPMKVKDAYEAMSNIQIESMFIPIFGDTKLLKRGVFKIDDKEFYYLHVLGTAKEGLQLYHKMFYYFNGNKTFCIDASSKNSMVGETSPYFGIMLSSFRF